MAEGTILTESGLKKLEEELDYLVSVRRNEISEQIAVARGFGDLSKETGQCFKNLNPLPFSSSKSGIYELVVRV